MLATVHHGQLRAQVPPAARGFSLNVDDMQIVDLGTEFGLSVSADSADVQVFDGEVELHHADRSKLQLNAGEAVTRSSTGEIQTGSATPERFLDLATMESHASEQTRVRYERWKAWSRALCEDPRLITYYRFDNVDSWQRRLPADVHPLNRELDGAIVGATRTTGRWPTKSALEFKRPGDRVRVNIPGEFQSLTFTCWVKIDSLDRWYNSLFLTDHYNQGEPHWQILDTGQLFFSVRSRPDEVEGQPVVHGPSHKTVLSPVFWEPSMSGKWIQLATTYDAEAARTTHYLNGAVLHSETIPQAQQVKTTRIGAASIGNWALPTKPDAEFAIRNLNGSIDEFAIFSAALSADEIREFYDYGKP